MSQLQQVECNDEMEQELNHVLDEGKKKNKSGHGRSKVVQNERLSHGPMMFRNKINTLMSNASHLVHQSGCNAVILIKDEEDRVYTYISPQWRSTYRNNPEAYGTVVNMCKDCEGAKVEPPTDKRSYSERISYTPVEILGNVKDANCKTLVKRNMDTYVYQDCTSIPLSPQGGLEVDEDGEAVQPLDAIRKKIAFKRQEKDQEDEDQEKDLKKAKALCSAFENANIVSTGHQKAPKPSFSI